MIYNLLKYYTFLSKPHGQEMTVPIKIKFQMIGGVYGV
jgi:hypothetical protein